jgi:peptidoglycan/LPS O-acetylase OafA/YrhL
LALLLVICYHAGGVLDQPNVLHGELGVDVFLMVSGFTLALSSVDLSARQFFQRRFLRIFPAYWLALGLFLWMNWQFLGRTCPAGDIGLHVLGLHGFGPIDSFVSINDSFWFIAMIVPAYGVFFGLRRHLDDFPLVVAVGAILTTIACVACLEAGHFGGLIHLGLRIPSFSLSLLVGRLLGTGTMEIRVDFRLGLGLLCFLPHIRSQGALHHAGARPGHHCHVDRPASSAGPDHGGALAARRLGRPGAHFL